MRVLHLITDLSPAGAQTLLLDMLPHLGEPSDEFAVGYLWGRPRASEGGGLGGRRLFDLSLGGRPDPRLVWRVLRLLRRERFEIVHTHLVHAGIAGKIAAALAGGIPVVTTRHYAWDHKEGTALYRLENRLTRRCAAVIAVSDAVRDYLIEQEIATADQVTTIPNGVDLGRFDPSGHAFDPISARDAPVIGTAGRLHPQKGHAVGLRALALVSKRYPQAVLEIIGSGGLRNRLEQEARDLGVADRVRFLGTVPHEDMAGHMARWSLAVFPSLWEGFGIAAAEAMAMALPVVASGIEGLTEVVSDGETGILVPPGDPDALAGGILRVLSDRGAAREMGRKGRARIEERYSIQRSAACVRQIYESVLKAERSRRQP